MPHNDQTNLAIQVAETLTRGQKLSLITDAIVLAATTRQGLIDAINAVPTHNELTNLKIEISKVLRYDPNITDAAVSSATTAAGLIALTGYSGLTGSALLD